MEINNQENELYRMAQKRIKEIKGFYVHLIVFVLVNIFIFLLNSNIFGSGNVNIHFSNLSLPFFWGIGLAAHCASVFGPNLFLGKKWEEKKIKEILDKEKQQRSKWE
jgi:hypothetical protein